MKLGQRKVRATVRMLAGEQPAICRASGVLAPTYMALGERLRSNASLDRSIDRWFFVKFFDEICDEEHIL
jgi:hypothetical protein